MASITYNTLGNSGLKIAPIILGCMSYGNKSWASWVIEDEDKVFGILKRAYDKGLRTFDTADVYSNGTSEILIGKFIKKYNIPRDKIVILSKCYFPLHSDPSGPRVNIGSDSSEFEWANSSGLSRKHIFDAVQASVDRLGTYIDVLQIHRLDRSTPKTEIMRALNDVVSNGQVRYIGASSMKATEFAQLQFIADKYNWVKFISMQSFYNLIQREDERELIPFCNENEFGKVGLIPWSPIARGLLARPHSSDSEFGRGAKTDQTFKATGLSDLTSADIEIINRVEEIAKKRDVSMAVVSTSWVISKGANPIVGINSESRLDELIEGLSFKLSEEEIKYLEEPYQPKKPYV